MPALSDNHQQVPANAMFGRNGHCERAGNVIDFFLPDSLPDMSSIAGIGLLNSPVGMSQDIGFDYPDGARLMA